MLLLGLKYIPIPLKTSHLEDLLRTNLQKFHRSLRLRAYFADTTREDKLSYNRKKHYYIPNPSWNPPTKDINVERFIEENTATFESLIQDINQTPLTKLNQFASKLNPNHGKIGKAIFKLNETSNTVIKQADKNVAICLIDRDKYLELIHDQILHPPSGERQNFTFLGCSDDSKVSERKNIICEKLQSTLTNMLQQINNEKEKTCPHKYKKDISQDTTLLTHLLANTKPDFTPPELYGLPKVHKLKSTDADTISKVLSGLIKLEMRPIIAAHTSIYTNVSKFLNAYLQDFIQSKPTCSMKVNEILHRINHLECPADHQMLIISADIVSLYPNVNTNELKDALVRYLPTIRRHSSIHMPFSDLQIIQIIELMITNNLINFNNKTYLQTSGLIMGDNLAPALAIIYILNLEEKHVESYLNLQTTDATHTLLFNRFIDDILLIMAIPNDSSNAPEIAQNKFLSAYNSMAPNIKIVSQSSLVEHTVTYLDIEIMINNERNQIETRTYFKETNRFIYLDINSFHPVGAFKGFLITELKRYLPHSSQERFYNETKALFAARLLKRNYPIEIIEEIFNQIPWDTELRKQLLNGTKTETKKYKTPILNKLKKLKYNFNSNSNSNETLTTKPSHPTNKKPPHHEPIVLTIPFTHINFKLMLQNNSHYNELPTHMRNKFIIGYSNSPNIKSMLIRAKLPAQQIPTFTTHLNQS
jgi:hypothetical protein